MLIIQLRQWHGNNQNIQPPPPFTLGTSHVLHFAVIMSYALQENLS